MLKKITYLVILLLLLTSCIEIIDDVTLNSNGSVSNDYSYDEVYSRLVKAFGKQSDILVAISTSGNSKNVVKAVEVANSLGMITVSLTGEKESKLSEISNYTIKVPSIDTPRIQEAHILIGHIICEIVENNLF
jgi:D-sedoheptulose 7-phosphate isomerase